LPHRRATNKGLRQSGAKRGEQGKGRNWPRLKGVTIAIGAGVNAACSMTQNGQVALVVASSEWDVVSSPNKAAQC